jgi:hypothetical protein
LAENSTGAPTATEATAAEAVTTGNEEIRITLVAYTMWPAASSAERVTVYALGAAYEVFTAGPDAFELSPKDQSYVTGEEPPESSAVRRTGNPTSVAASGARIPTDGPGDTTTDSAVVAVPKRPSVTWAVTAKLPGEE